ncbi:MAG: DUF899 family protein [Caulobacterales bacterium]|nr:DUF899 family protein [Caulobacterales bacterium]
MTIHFPNESAAYREARDRLLASERELRGRLEAIAAERRALPPGGLVTGDYRFQSAGGEVALAGLFAPGKRDLALYSFMYGPGASAPCPMCASFLDSLDRAAPHLLQTINLAVTVTGPLAPALAFAEQRGWRHLRLLSSEGTSYGRDYHGEAPDGAPLPMMNVFHKTGDEVRHHWASELLFAGAQAGQDPRHMDLMWPVWPVLDLTRAGRGDWRPSVTYR